METKITEYTVNIPSVDEFAKEYPQYGKLAQGEFSFLFELLMSPEAYLKGRVVTIDLGLPAVAGVAEMCHQAVKAQEAVKWNNLLKQFIGAAMRTLMKANGFEKTGKKKAIPHRKFTKGEVYEQVA